MKLLFKIIYTILAFAPIFFLFYLLGIKLSS
jgi:hypothetical protein